MNLRSLLLYIPFLFLPTALSGQYYDSGQDPASLKWMQIRTNSFRVIYPEGYGDQGLAFARALQDASSRLTALFPEKKYTIPVIIHNYTTQSNGYVSWAPRRMELYPTPEQNTIPLDPNTQLAIHEVTHVIQMQSLRTGFTKAMSVAFGEQFTGLVSALLPLWYLEGDAVFAESFLTSSGRGRSPSFQKQLKAIVTDKKIYSFEKMINGSYRDFIPDHYQVGYQMVAYGGLRYDHEIWNKMVSFTGKYPFTVIPNNISLLNSARLTRRKLYIKTFSDLRTAWKEDISESDYILYTRLSPDKGNKYINYHSPVIAGADSLIAIKTSLKKPSSLVLIRPSGRSEKRLFTPGFVYPFYISSAQGKVVWIEDQPDPRWKNRNYSVVKILDIKTGRSEKLTAKSRYLSAAISPDGNNIAAVENTVNNKNNVVLIDPVSGSVKKSVPAPENAFLQRPQWSGNGSEVTFISLTKGGEGIISWSPRDDGWQTLIEPSYNDLQSSFLRNDSLFFVSSVSGTDNLYIRTPDKSIHALTNSKFGISDIIISGGQAIFSDYLVLGNTICQADIKESVMKPGVIPDSSYFLIRSFEKSPGKVLALPDADLNPVPYRKWQHLFNFHSWMPFYADLRTIQADPLAVRPGFTIMTQNHLSTLISSLGYEYSDDRRHKLHSRLTWQGWYPVIESRLDYGDAPLISRTGTATSDPRIPSQSVRFQNSVSVPLSFSTGKFSQFLSPYFTVDYINRYIQKSATFTDYGQTNLSARLYFSNIHRPAFRDIYPRWAQVADLNYTSSPFDKQIFGWSASAKTAFFFPGIFSNNSTRIRLEGERQEWVMFYMRNNIHVPRGYSELVAKELIYLSVDYTMPLLYPDLNIPGFLYIKRIRGSAFFDAARSRGTAHFNQDNALDRFTEDYEFYSSYGFELLSDFHLLRNPFMISAGIQAAWPDYSRSPVLEFVLNIDIFGMTIGRSKL